MADTPSVLIVDDSADDAELLLRELRRLGYEPAWERVDTAEDMRASLASRRWDIILCDYRIPGFGALEALQVLSEAGGDVPLVIVSGGLGEQAAVEAMKLGAADYVLKESLGRLGPILKRELSEVAVRRRLARTQIQWKAAFDSVSDAIFILDGTHRILRFNRAYAKLARAPAKAILHQPYWEMFPRMGGPMPCCLKAAGEPGIRREEEVTLDTGQIFLARHFPILDERGQSGNVLHVMQDITERKGAERRIVRLRRLYETRSETSRLIMNAADEHALFSAVCYIAVQQGGMVGAIVRIADEESLDLRPVAFTENMRAVAEQLRVGIDPAQPLLPAANAYFSGRLYIQNDLLEESGLFAVPIASGARSIAVLPLRRGGRPVGTLSLFAGEAHFIDAEMGQLLEEMATDISFALDNFERARQQQRAQQALLESEAKFRGLVEQRLAGISIVEDGCFTYLNARFAEMFGYAEGELLGKPVITAVAEEDHARVAENFRRRLSGELQNVQYTFNGRRKDGSTIVVEVYGTIATVSGRKVVVSLLQDITERVRSEQQTMRLARARRVMAECNRTLVHAVDETRMLDEMCRIAIGVGGYRMAWVGMARNDPGRTIEPVARAGEDAGYLETIRVSWGDNEFGRGPAGRAVRTLQPQATGNIASDPRFTRWRAEAIKRKYRAVAALPLIHAGKAFGVIAVFSADAEAFDAQEVALLQELASDIAFGVVTLRERRERARAEAALAAKTKVLRNTFENMDQGISLIDGELRVIGLNRRFLELLDFPPSLFAGEFTPLEDVYRFNARRGEYGPGDVEEQVQARLAIARRFEAHLFERVRPNGTVLEIRGQPLPGGGFVTTYTDITERKRSEAALRQAEELFRQLAGNIPEAFWVREADSNAMLYVSPGWEIITGLPAPADWQGVLRVLHPEDQERLAMEARQFAQERTEHERRIVRPDGSVRWLHVQSFPIRNERGEVYRIAGMAEDVTERKAAEQRLLQMAHYDSLTALPNRKLFFDSLNRTLDQAEHGQWIVAVMFIDLDRFKVVNDTLGHATGDALLQQVASRLLGCVRVRDIVGRLGGDEFAMILPGLDKTDDAALIAAKVVAAFADPFELEGREVFVTASVGITVFPFDAKDAPALMRYADTAMYRAKEEGRNIYRYYTAALNERALEKMELESHLRRAREREEFLLYYQPKVNLLTGRIVGVEALLRWRRPGVGLLPPADYIPLLEETGLIVAVGEWVIAEACRQIVAWGREGVQAVPIAVNLSPRQFHDKQLASVIAGAVERAGIDPGLLECEITESSLMLDAAETIRILRVLRAGGSTLSIDDFGTGYSSLGYLKRFPIHAVKIDRSFVSDIMSSTEDAALARGIIGMAHSLNLKVIAEGVETEEQRDFLRANGCDQGQGYLFSKPLDAAAITRFLRAHKPALHRGKKRPAAKAPRRAPAAPARKRAAPARRARE